LYLYILYRIVLYFMRIGRCSSSGQRETMSYVGLDGNNASGDNNDNYGESENSVTKVGRTGDRERVTATVQRITILLLCRRNYENTTTTTGRADDNKYETWKRFCLRWAREVERKTGDVTTITTASVAEPLGRRRGGGRELIIAILCCRRHFDLMGVRSGGVNVVGGRGVAVLLQLRSR